MMRRLVLCFLLCVAATAVHAKSPRVQTVSATYTYHATPLESPAEAKRTALERAKIQAMADVFGTLVSQSTSTRVVNSGTESNVDMFSHGMSQVRGQWLETIGEPEYNIVYDQDMLVVTVSVKGRARELSRSSIALEARVLRNGTESRFEDDEFRSGDDLFLEFMSPVDGYLLVYLVDHVSDEVFCLLPYSGSSEGARRVEHDRSYVFFSAAAAPQERDVVDEYTMTFSGGKVPDRNEIVLIFSPNEVVKTVTQRADARLPRQLPLADFEKWRAGVQTADPDLQIIYKPITISK